MREDCQAQVKESASPTRLRASASEPAHTIGPMPTRSGDDGAAAPRRRATKSGPTRQRDAKRTREEILNVATREFADRGYSGARVDEIAARTATTKRMIYYYFGGKEQLYIACLERSYATIRAAEQRVDVEHLDPTAAIRRLAELTFDHHEANPDFIKLVSFENIVEGEHMARSKALLNLNTPAIEVISRILKRGYADGVFRRRVDAIDLHMMISSFCFFRVSNRYTFRAIFGRDMMDTRLRRRYRRALGDMVVEYLSASPEATTASEERQRGRKRKTAENGKDKRPSARAVTTAERQLGS